MGPRIALPLALVLCAAALAAIRATADAPLPTPDVRTIWSPGRGCCAVMDPRRQVTTVFRLAGEERTKAWSMVGWYGGAALADDGEHVVILPSGLNLLPLDVRDDDVVLWFVRRGELVATVSLGEVAPRATLRRTPSPWAWASLRGLDAEGRYVVETNDGKAVRFDVTTGARVP